MNHDERRKKADEWAKANIGKLGSFQWQQGADRQGFCRGLAIAFAEGCRAEAKDHDERMEASRLWYQEHWVPKCCLPPEPDSEDYGFKAAYKACLELARLRGPVKPVTGETCGECLKWTEAHEPTWGFCHVFRDDAGNRIGYRRHADDKPVKCDACTFAPRPPKPEPRGRETCKHYVPPAISAGVKCLRGAFGCTFAPRPPKPEPEPEPGPWLAAFEKALERGRAEAPCDGFGRSVGLTVWHEGREYERRVIAHYEAAADRSDARRPPKHEPEYSRAHADGDKFDDAFVKAREVYPVAGLVGNLIPRFARHMWDAALQSKDTRTCGTCRHRHPRKKGGGMSCENRLVTSLCRWPNDPPTDEPWCTYQPITKEP